jgi:hypothetical protein
MTQMISGKLEEVIKQAVAAGIPPAVEVRLLWETHEEPNVIAPENAAVIAYLKERLEQALTDPDRIQLAEAELRILHQNLEKNRIEAGESPILTE